MMRWSSICTEDLRIRARWWLVAALTVLFASSNVGAGPAWALQEAAPLVPAPPEGVAPGEILVKFEPGAPASAVADAHRRNSGRVKGTIPGVGVQVVAVERGRERALVASYNRNPNVRFAEENGLYRAADHGKPNDPRVGEQWQLRNDGQTGGKKGADLYAFEAWHTTTGSAPIAVLDSGIRQDHADLQSKVAKSQNFTTSPTDDDRYGHGTHVAGSAGAASGNGVGVAGTCGGCPLYNAKVLDDAGNGTYSSIANGLVWAADKGAKVANMSFGGASPSLTMEEAVNYAWSKGVVLVAAAGNSGTDAPFYPAAYPNVIAVAATDHNDQKASFSNHGASWVDVAAPGAAILSTTNDGAFGTKSGTSMASPHAAGAAGLAWSGSPAGTTNQEIRDKVEASADPVAGTGTYWSKGRVNACKAVGGGASCERDLTAPVVSGVAPSDGATGVALSANVSAAFSEAMDPATLTSSTVALTKDGTTTPVAATVSVSPDGKTVTLDPSASLAKRTKYAATVKGGMGGAKDLASNPLAADKTWSFTTGTR